MALQGRRAIVTGASGGTGVIIVQRFLSEGMRVVAVVHSEKKHPFEGAQGLSVLQADVTREDDVQRLFAEATRLLGGLDILVNGVGGFVRSSPVQDLSAADWDAMMSMNLRSVFLCTREALRYMKGKGYGRIVNFSAQTALRPVPGKAAYSVSKAAVSVFTDVVAREMRNEGITINAIAPSIINTEVNRTSMPGEDFAKWVSPEDIADTICSLCSERSVLNGTTLKAFGGL
ncbi:MAG: SDR family oxidoreductase [Ignavibacteriales bacterium]|nr:SDR family oxidoreductase [Ignavibacteriales bacterium]